MFRISPVLSIIAVLLVVAWNNTLLAQKSQNAASVVTTAEIIKHSNSNVHNNSSGISYFKYDGKEILIAKSGPQVASILGPNATAISSSVELSNNDTRFHYYDSSDFAIVDPKVQVPIK